MQKKATEPRRALTARLDELMPIIEERLQAGQSVEIYPRGKSMRPLLREGRDSVVLSAPPSALRENDIVLFLYQDKYVLHRLISKTHDGNYVFCGDRRSAFECAAYEQIVAVVTEIKRNGQTVRTDTASHRAYLALLKIKRRVRYLWYRIKRRMARTWRKTTK